MDGWKTMFLLGPGIFSGENSLLNQPVYSKNILPNGGDLHGDLPWYRIHKKSPTKQIQVFHSSLVTFLFGLPV